jgi:hypothetical protein
MLVRGNSSEPRRGRNDKEELHYRAQLKSLIEAVYIFLVHKGRHNFGHKKKHLMHGEVRI